MAARVAVHRIGRFRVRPRYAGNSIAARTCIRGSYAILISDYQSYENATKKVTTNRAVLSVCSSTYGYGTDASDFSVGRNIEGHLTKDRYRTHDVASKLDAIRQTGPPLELHHLKCEYRHRRMLGFASLAS